MSWLARSIADGLRLDGDATEDDDEEEKDDDIPQDAIQPPTVNHPVHPEEQDLRSSNSSDDACDNHGQGHGVQEDLSELKASLARQLWGVASFLAPPPPTPPTPPPPPPPFNHKSNSLHKESEYGGDESGNDDEDDNDELVVCDARGSGQFEELASSSPPEDYYARMLDGAIGITDEVLAFARNIAHHPETWLDFPIEEEEFDDFDITDAQYHHVLAIEHLAPRLAALRIEFCPIHMNEGYFWMVYFVLLHSRLNKHDADLLSSPQIVQARGMWMQELQKQTKEASYRLETDSFNSKESAFPPLENFAMHSYKVEQSVSDQIKPIESPSHRITPDYVIEKHLVNEIDFIDKPVIREDPLPELQDKEMVLGSSFKIPVQHDDNDDDDGWLSDDSDLIGFSGPSVPVNEEEISFSDLEDDMDSTIPEKWKKTASTKEKE